MVQKEIRYKSELEALRTELQDTRNELEQLRVELEERQAKDPVTQEQIKVILTSGHTGILNLNKCCKIIWGKFKWTLSE